MRRPNYGRRRQLFVVGAIFVTILFIYGVYWIATTVITNAQSAVEHFSESISGEDKKKELEDITDDHQCNENDIRIEIGAKQAHYASGADVKFTVTTTYLGLTGCKTTTALDERVLYIASGNDQIYNSGKCVASDYGVMLAVGDKVDQEISWNGHRSGEDGCATGDTVKKGYYRAYVQYAPTADSPDLPTIKSNEVGFYID